MLPGPPRRRRARPVGDAPIEPLLNRTEDLAKGWLLALLEQAPLEQAPTILAADLTRDGPRICEALLRAIADDSAQQQLEPGGSLVSLVARVGELAGASGPDGTSQAVDALQAITWVALRSALPDPEPDLITALAERLAQVTQLIRVAALRAGAGPVAGAERPPVAVAPSRPDQPPSPPPPPADAPGPPPPVAGRREPFRRIQAEAKLRSWVPDQEPGPESEALWVRALDEQIARAEHAPLALVLAELEDADRMLAVESPPSLASAYGEFAHAVRGAVRRQDILAYETDARAWIIAPQTARAGAYALGARISEAVRNGRPWRGAPMVASIGIAVLGDDGTVAEQLIEAAERARFAAAARGIEILRNKPNGSPAGR